MPWQSNRKRRDRNPSRESKQDHIMRTHHETLRYCARIDAQRGPVVRRRAAPAPVPTFVPDRDTFRPQPRQWEPPAQEPQRSVVQQVVPATLTKPPATVPNTDGELLIDHETAVVTVGGVVVRLTEKEYKVLELLFMNRGQIVTKAMFMAHVYPGAEKPGENNIDVFLGNIRKKLSNASGGKQYIETVWSRGHKLRESHQAQQAAE